MDDEDLEAAKEMDKDRQASNKAEIQELAQEVNEGMEFFAAARDHKVEEAALPKV